METGAFPSVTLLICKDSTKITNNMYRPRGLMDKASDFGSEDSRFESWRGRSFYFYF